jgi:hypothetical protein
MKRAAPWALKGLLAFAVVVLLLNLREKDYYDGGSLTPPGGDGPALDNLLPSLLPPTVVHPCPTCGECTHPVEIEENRRTLTLRDEDGWYKLFWAGGETYYYDDLVFLAAGLLNRTARDPAGSWILRARLGPATHARAEPHPCGESLSGFLVKYDLFTSETPIPEEALSQGPLRVARVVQALARSYDRPHRPATLYFGWRLPDAEALVTLPAPCPCGRP